jgi:hypothetical protein
MTEQKFDKRYFEINYFIGDYKHYKNVVHRHEDSSGEHQYEVCLRACLTHFIGEDLTGAKRISTHFVTDHRLHKDHLKRCCCSKEVWRTDDEGTDQRVSISHAVVTHKLTELSFIVGKDCFHKLFVNAEDADTFFKETCKYCNKIVAKKSADRPYLCNQDCVKEYEKQEKAQQREKEEQERRKKMVYTPPPKKVWPKKVYEKCAECDMPKYGERERQFKHCVDCNRKIQLQKMLRSPDGEIHGWAD